MPRRNYPRRSHRRPAENHREFYDAHSVLRNDDHGDDAGQVTNIAHNVGGNLIQAHTIGNVSVRV